MIFDNSLFSLRFFSVFFSILAVISTYLFTNQAFKRKNLALFSSVLFAISAFQIQYAMEARMYALGAFLVIISSYLFLKALESGKWRWWLFYAIAISAGIYTHYFVFFWVAAQGLYFILNKKYFWKGFIAYLLIGISYIPWISTFLKQTSQVQENYWIPAINIWSIPNTFFKMTTGQVVDPSQFWYLLVFLMIVVILAVVYFLRKVETKTKWLIFSMLVLPFLIAIGLSFKTSIYTDRYFILGFPFYLIFLAGAILSIKHQRTKQSLIAIVILASIIAFPLHWILLDLNKKPGMAGASSYINTEVKENEKIFVGSSFVYFTFKYYNQTSVQPQLFAPDELPHFSGTALLSDEDIISDFNKETKTDDIVWLINTTGFGNYQPSVPQSWTIEEEKSFQDAYDYLGWIIVSKYKVQ